jgi:serine/threonine-protein kinase HipA
VLDRFDLIELDDGRIERLGFEDIAALAGLRVRDTLSDRKYQGSYQAVVELLKQLQLPRENLRRFFEQVAFSVMVRNGDAHLKNFGLLYRSATDAWLAPMFDVVTTTIYRYTRYEGGPELEDKTMALKLLRGRHQSRAYPTNEALMAFGRRLCGVAKPAVMVQNIAQAMSETLAQAKHDERIPPPLHLAISTAWEAGSRHARSS